MDHEWIETVNVPSKGVYTLNDARLALNTMSHFLQKPTEALADALASNLTEDEDKKHRDFILSAANVEIHDVEYRVSPRRSPTSRIGLKPDLNLSGRDDMFQFRGFRHEDIRRCVDNLHHCTRLSSENVIELLADPNFAAKRWLHDAVQNRAAISGMQPVYELRQFSITQGLPNGDWKPSEHYPLAYTRYAGSATNRDEANQLMKNIRPVFEYMGSAWYSEEDPRLTPAKVYFAESAYTRSFFDEALLSEAQRQSALHVVRCLHTAALDTEWKRTSSPQFELNYITSTGHQALLDSCPVVDGTTVKLAMLAIDPTLHPGSEARYDQASLYWERKIHDLAIEAVDRLVGLTSEWGVPKMPLSALAIREDERISNPFTPQQLYRSVA